MPVDLGKLYPPDWGGTPPHAASNDLPLWERFQEKYGKDFSGFYFDSSLGTPSFVPEGTEDNLARMWTRITSKRMDVVGVKDDVYWIIELRPQAAAGALGTIMTYLALWKSDPPDDKAVIGVIVTDFPDPDLIPLAASNNIKIVVV
jgi:hypothetical protein